jgi:hypothetical protein
MINDWYVELNYHNFPEEFQQLTYDLADARGQASKIEACRMSLYYNNPDYDEEADHINHVVEINPAALDFSGSVSFTDQVKDIIAEAEALIIKDQTAFKQKFNVDGSAIGMLECEPAPGKFAVGRTTMEPKDFSSSKYVPISKVALSKLQADIQLYLDYRNNERNQYIKAQKSKARKGANLLDKLENLSAEEMLIEVNKTLKRQKLSVVSLLETLIEDANSNGVTNVATVFYDLLDPDNWLTKDGEPAYKVLDEAFQKATYDNGKPLTGYNDPEDPQLWHDYFEHYDRDQDYDSIFNDDRVTKVSYIIGDKLSLKLFFDFTSDQLTAWVANEYGGAEYAHDFKQ